MTMKKCMLTALLALVMIISLCAGAFAAGLDNFWKSNNLRPEQFTDLPVDYWAYENVKSAFDYGLMKGVSDNSFYPGSGLSAAQAIALSARIHSIYYTGWDNFRQGTPWYQCYVNLTS